MADFKPHDPPYLAGPDALDGLGRMIIALAREVWVLRDRLTIAEQLLEEHGVFPRSAIDTYVPSAELEAELLADSDTFVERVMGAPFVEARPIDDVVESALRWTATTRERSGRATA